MKEHQEMRAGVIIQKAANGSKVTKVSEQLLHSLSIQLFAEYFKDIILKDYDETYKSILKEIRELIIEAEVVSKPNDVLSVGMFCIVAKYRKN